MKDVKFRVISLSLAAAGLFAGALLATPLIATPALAQERCVRSSAIGSIRLTDPQTVTISMRNGTQYRSTLRNTCNVHRFEFFSYSSYNGHLCKGDRLRAAKNGRVCVLGDLEKVG